jgi:hypothetical protein
MKGKGRVFLIPVRRLPGREYCPRTAAPPSIAISGAFHKPVKLQRKGTHSVLRVDHQKRKLRKAIAKAIA